MGGAGFSVAAAYELINGGSSNLVPVEGFCALSLCKCFGSKLPVKDGGEVDAVLCELTDRSAIMQSNLVYRGSVSSVSNSTLTSLGSAENLLSGAQEPFSSTPLYLNNNSVYGPR